jgi:hypothetical protein
MTKGLTHWVTKITFHSVGFRYKINLTLNTRLNVLTPPPAHS